MENNHHHHNQPPSPPPFPPALRSSSSASSLTAQLFGDNDFRNSSAGIFASVFPSSSTMTGNSTCVRCSKSMQFEPIDSQVKRGFESAENVAKNTLNAITGVMSMDRMSIFQERIEPSPLSSSIYYGGQEDMYVRSSTDLPSKSYTKFLIKDDPKDDPNHLQSATRGNWWQVKDRFTIKMLRVATRPHGNS